MVHASPLIQETFDQLSRNPAKTLMLVQEIRRLLKEKETWLKRTLKHNEGRT